MRMSLLVLSTSVILTGCFKYQYATVESSLAKSKDGEFKIENDTFKIKLWFSGEDGPIHIEIFNKLSQPLYVDWKKSAFIENERRYPFWSDISSVDVYSKLTSGFGSRTSGPTRGTLYQSEQISFIPTQSFVKLDKGSMRSEFFKISDSRDNKTNVQVKTIYGSQAGKKFSFQKENTPMKFRCFITLATTEDFSSPIFIDNEFWVSDLTTSLADPKNIMRKQANQFFIREGTAFGVGTVTIVGLVVLVVYVVGSR
jgi:hypothetical protein